MELGNSLFFLCLPLSLWREKTPELLWKYFICPRFTAAGRLLNSISLSHNQSKDIIHLLEMS